jgi:GNAT superfamily N-acetyltransferase
VEVRRFDALSASDDELRQLHRMSVAILAIDQPTEPRPTFDNFVGRLRNPASDLGALTRWVAEDGGRIVARAGVYFPDAENRHLGLVENLTVDPEARRRGVGTLMLRTVLPDLLAGDRTTIESWSVVADGPGEGWARSHGFRRTHAMLIQELLTRQAEPARWDIAPPPGYRLVSWRGSCPDDLVASFASTRTAIEDAPIGEAGIHAVQWTVARVRESEHELAAAGIENLTCVAVDEATGAVAGLTMVELHPHRRDWAYQRDTAVLAAHRGHGLGRCVKAAMTRSLITDVPELERVITNTRDVQRTHDRHQSRRRVHRRAWSSGAHPRRA